MRILIIEDDKSLAETLRFQLEQHQFETAMCVTMEKKDYILSNNSPMI